MAELVRVENGILSGSVNIPPSKSAAHRAVLCAAMAKGKSLLSPSAFSEDILATCASVEALGAHVQMDAQKIVVDGSLFLSTENVQINCRESGSTLRFLIPIAAAGGIHATFEGTGRLPERPIGVYLECLPKAGIQCITSGGLPLAINGKLKPGTFLLPGNISSQFITGLMMALPLTGEDSEIILTTPLESAGYIDMTIEMMQQFGVTVKKHGQGWKIAGGQFYQAHRQAIEGDWSQAAFFIAGGALGGPVSIHGLRMDSLQGDMACTQLFRRFGAAITTDGNSLHIQKGNLTAIDIDASQIPDLVPILAVIAALAKGRTNITGASRLRIKESDRLSAISAAINAVGGRTIETKDGLMIDGVQSFQGGRVDGQNDHRIVMAMSVAALRSENPIEITCPHAIKKSYPSFFEDYNSLGGNAHVISLG